MPLPERDRNRIEALLTLALAHPIRLRILEIFTRDPSQPLSLSTFFPDLVREFDDLTPGQVRYHLARLQDAELLPA